MARNGNGIETAARNQTNREGTWDFVNIVPRIAVGVIAALIPQEIITGWLGPMRDCR